MNPVGKNGDTSKWMTTEEVADFLGVSVNTVYILARSGGPLQAYQPGLREFRFLRTDIEAYLESRRKK